MKTIKTGDDDEDMFPAPNVVIEFKRSSQGKGGEGFRVVVTEAATLIEVRTALDHAMIARRECLQELGLMVLPIEQVEAFEAQLAAIGEAKEARPSV